MSFKPFLNFSSRTIDCLKRPNRKDGKRNSQTDLFLVRAFLSRPITSDPLQCLNKSLKIPKLTTAWHSSQGIINRPL